MKLNDKPPKKWIWQSHDGFGMALVLGPLLMMITILLSENPGVAEHVIAGAWSWVVLMMACIGGFREVEE